MGSCTRPRRCRTTESILWGNTDIPLAVLAKREKEKNGKGGDKQDEVLPHSEASAAMVEAAAAQTNSDAGAM